ncbi:MAG TPA: Mur ligase family protein [Deltaproteobacteria bacterium]|jgi:dihydrofolate synthase/folylpolyglutamate synthase|nr:Mur ligase family protein [Deltaproteobacteria bacterium]HOI07921.1 Mur ligase family protein [Deltaproteobacteria bacterium]
MVLSGTSPNVWVFGIERVRRALDRLGCPERSCRHVIVAGTNGKGSTCIYLERILMTMGYRVGTTISPHVTRFSERFRIDGQDADETVLERIHKELETLLGDIGLTYFEWCVILAAQLFKDHRVDFGIYEVGLGGRYDAANALDPEVCLITDISLDHTELLGSTVEEIAGEKGAIARKGRPLITSATGPAHETIRACAREAGAPFLAVETPWEGTTSLKGDRQPMNAALALQAAAALGVHPDREQAAHALNTAFLPGRIEEIRGRVILDVAHNPGAIEGLMKYLEKIGFHGVGVFGVLGDKDYRSMVAMLRKACRTLYIAPVRSERSWTPAQMEEVCSGEGVKPCGSIGEAFREAWSTGEQVLVTGSFYTVGEVRETIVCQSS